MNDFKLNSVNWQDGMLLTMNHFRDQDRYFADLARWYAAGAGDNYGLVKKSPQEASLKLNAILSGNRLKVEVSRCQALMQSGTFVDFNESVSGGEVLKAESDINETHIPVFLGVDPGNRKQTGEPDPSEEIPRVPYEIPGYTVSLIEPPNLPGDMYLQIARLSVSGSEVSRDTEYFPPCVTISADENLAALAVDYRNRLENLLKLSTRAFMAVTSSKGLEGASTNLQNDFKDTTYYLVYHLASHLDDFVIGRNAPHPSGMIIQFKKLFRVVSSLLNLRPGLKDYLNEKFFAKETDSDIGGYLSSVDGFLLSEYDHTDIASQIKVVDRVLGVLRALMAFLAQTKVEQLSDQAVATETITYQGKTYKNVQLSGSALEEAGELSYLTMELGEEGPVKDALTLINKEIFSEMDWRSMQVRLGLNKARGLGETDPVNIDTTTYQNKVVLHPLDMLQSPSVKQATLIFRGTPDTQKLAGLGKSDLLLYIIRE